MKYLVVSDTHGHISSLLNILDEHKDIDTLIHLGDGIRDIEQISQYFSCELILVEGNNDYYDCAPLFQILEICGQKFFFCHGHKYNVRHDRSHLAAVAGRLNCSYVFYGHTHIKSDETINGIRLLNPGSLGYPYGESGVFIIDDDADKIAIDYYEIK